MLIPLVQGAHGFAGEVGVSHIIGLGALVIGLLLLLE